MNDVAPVPEGLPTMIPALNAKPAAEAIDFYREAFGATEAMARIMEPDGRIGHAELQVGNSMFYLADEFPEINRICPKTQGSQVNFSLNLPDVDEVVKRAVAAGAELVRAPADQFYGDRTGTIADPWGYHWTISTHVEDVSEEEMQRRYAEMQKD